MDRNREARRASTVGSNGFNRRKHRTNSLRDSPDEDGGVELQESVKLRDRAMKKDRDRERGRDLRERDLRERDLRERSGNRSKRRGAERLMNSRDDIGRDETSDESDNDDLDEEYEETTTTTSTASAVTGVRFPVGSGSNYHHHGHVGSHHGHEKLENTCVSTTTNNNMIISGNHHLQHRKSFPPISSSKVYRAAPVWKPGDEMIGVSVPRKARSASTKRLHDWASSSSHNNGGGGVVVGDQILRQASNSPVRTGLVSTPSPSPAPPMSPSSSNASARKKRKHSSGNANGQKLKPPKGSMKPSSSNPEELEIEIAEVLYGLMTQSQAPSSKKEDSKEVNRSTGDSKPRASPSISNTSSANNPVAEPNSTPLSAVAPKRKRPRQVSENSSYGARLAPKPEMDQAPKPEIASPNLERVSGSTGEDGFEMGANLVNSQVQPLEWPESVKLVTESKPVAVEAVKETGDSVATEETSSTKEKESDVVRTHDLDFNRVGSASMATDSVSATEIIENPVESEIANLRQEKFQIDLMAPPPLVRSSPERESGIDSVAQVVDEKPVLSVLDLEMKAVFLKDRENENGKRWRDELANVAAEEKKGRVMDRDAESEKGNENKVRSIDLKLDLENGEKDGVNATGNRAFKPNKEELLTEKTGQSTSPLPLPVSMASWPGGLPPMGYMAPLQGVIPMDGTTVPPMPLQSFAHPRPKRCATHCFIAKNIQLLQQFLKMNPFFTPPAPGPTALFGSKPFGHSIMPAADMHNAAVRGVNNAQDKGQSVANVQNHGGVKEKSSQSVSTPDSGQRKQQQILIQQALPSVPPSNLMAPAFIFPLNQHQAAMAAASARPTTGKSSNGGNTTATSSNVSNSAAASAPAPTGGATNPMNFNYPNMPVNETQYLAILQNNGYPFTMPPTNYRGTPGQTMPFGSFYPSQMIHPSQMQPPSAQLPQNSSASGNSLSQKNSQRSQPGNSNPQNFPSQKPQQLQQVSQLQQPSQNQQRQQQQRNHENENGNEDSPSGTDSCNLRASVNIYGQNFTMPIHPQNYPMVTPPSVSGNQSEKKPQQAQPPPPHSFAMSFGSINGAIPGMGIDLASMAQNHAFFQSFPEAARQNMQMMAAAQVVQKKNFRISEEGNNNNNKSVGGDSSANDDERKNSKSQSIAFTRSDLADPSAQASNVVESSSRPGPTRNSQAMNNNVANAHIQSQNQQQQQQMMQLMQHRQQQLAGNTGNNRNKTQVSSNGSLYPEHLNSSSPSMAAKFPNSISGFPQNLVQSSSNSPNQSPPWKSSSRTPPISQAPSSLASSNPSTIKNLPQQHNSQIRPQMHTQISFGGSQKRSTNSPGQAPPSNSQAPSAIGSPTTSSVSKGAGGSPRITNSAPTNKMGQAQVSALSAQQAQNSQAQKSLSILGNPSSAKQQAQQQMPKNMQQAQLFFSNPYTQAQSPHSTGSNSGPSGYFMQQRRRPEQQQQQPSGGPGASLNGMLLGSTGTNDPAKAIAAATCNLKGGGLPTQGMMHAAQFAAQSSGMVLPAGFTYVHPVPTAVQVKPAEQKQPGQPEKK